jgi:hypothetical protein
MIRLDRAALDYILEVAVDSGFSAQRITAREVEGDFPDVTIIFRQTGAPGPQSGPSREDLERMISDALKASQPQPDDIEPPAPPKADKFTTLD